MSTVPFTISNVYLGLAEAEGFLSVEGSDLTFEFRTVDSLARLIKTSVRTVRVPLKAVTDMRLHKGWLGTTLNVQVVQLHGAADIPGFEKGKITLSIAKKNLAAADALISSVTSVRMTETKTSRGISPE